MKTKALGWLCLCLLAGCPNSPGSSDSGALDAPSAGALYAPCTTNAMCGGLTCEQAFTGEPMFCTQRCTSNDSCRTAFGPSAICQSTDSGGLCTVGCDVVGGCPLPSRCRGVGCQVF